MAGLNGIILGQIRKHRCRNDIGDGDRHGDGQADHNGERLRADQGYNGLIVINGAVQADVYGTGTQQQRLLAHLSGQKIHQRVGGNTDSDGNDSDDGDPHIGQGQKIGDVVDLGGVKKGEGHPHDQIADGDDGEVGIGEGGF